MPTSTRFRSRARLARLVGELNADDPISLTETQRAAREEIMATPIPAEIADAIENEYRGSGMMSRSPCGRRDQPRTQATARSPA
jgi:phosphoenolpyruvate synthase/pyruvate phosphate dikinase